MPFSFHQFMYYYIIVLKINDFERNVYFSKLSTYVPLLFAKYKLTSIIFINNYMSIDMDVIYIYVMSKNYP